MRQQISLRKLDHGQRHTLVLSRCTRQSIGHRCRSCCLIINMCCMTCSFCMKSSSSVKISSKLDKKTPILAQSLDASSEVAVLSPQNEALAP